MFKGRNAGFMGMVLSVLGVVLFVTLYSSLISPFNTLYTTANATWIAFGTVISIVPTILFLSGIFGMGIGYWKSYGIAARGDTNGFMLMILGVLELILFVTLFSTIMTGLAAILTANTTNFIALTTVVGISPTVLFLMGIFASIGTAVGGYKHRKRGRAGALV